MLYFDPVSGGDPTDLRAMLLGAVVAVISFLAVHKQGKRNFNNQQRRNRRTLRLMAIIFLSLFTALFAVCFLDPTDGRDYSYLWLFCCSAAELTWCIIRRHQLK